MMCIHLKRARFFFLHACVLGNSAHPLVLTTYTHMDDFTITMLLFPLSLIFEY